MKQERGAVRQLKSDAMAVTITAAGVELRNLGDALPSVRVAELELLGRDVQEGLPGVRAGRVLECREDGRHQPRW